VRTAGWATRPPPTSLANFEYEALGQHSRYKVTCECNEEDEAGASLRPARPGRARLGMMLGENRGVGDTPRPQALSSGSEAGSYLRLIGSCITQLKVQGPSRTCNGVGDTSTAHLARKL